MQVHWAVRNDDVEVLKNLLQREDDGAALLGGADYDKRTPLHVAAAHNSVAAAQLLLSAGAPRDSLDRWGRTALEIAHEREFKPMVKLLQHYGARRELGRSNFQYATMLHPPQSLDWLITNPYDINFEDSQLIGKGAFGEVHQATWRGTTVAVKTIKPSKSKNREVVKDFLNEVDLLVKLRHPNIVQFLAAAITEAPYLLVTEYLSGGDLHALIKHKGALPADLAVTFALDTARGMAYLHGGPNVVIHRDLKPRNLIIDETNSQLKVGDFGLSKLIRVTEDSPNDVYELTGETGSYRYMAPEAFLRKSYNTKVDVFSFAMILYEMFEGVPPFADEGDKEVAYRGAKEDRRPEFGAKTVYPNGMRELIMKCWSEFAEKRPRFDEIVQILEKMLDSRSQRDQNCFRDLLQRFQCHCHKEQISDDQSSS